MPEKIPVIRQVNIYFVIPQLLLLALLVALGVLLSSRYGVVLGALSYLTLSYCLRTFIPADHLKGIRATKAEAFAEAIPFFEKSYAFFRKHSWIDRYRFITMLSSSALSYTEMALVNIAFCYGQLGQGLQAKAWYERTLAEFPGSIIATSGLRLIEGLLEEKVKPVTDEPS